MDQIRAMRFFIRSAERGSLTAASEDFGYARGAASAIVSELERFLGVQLFERTTRKLRLTEDGEHYLKRAREIVSEIDGLNDEIGSAEKLPRGHLRVQVPAGLARLVIAPAISRFLAAYPQVTIDVLSRNGFPDFVGDRIDVAVLVGEPPMLDVVARPVGGIPVMTVAAPGYLASMGKPDNVDALSEHKCIGMLSSVSGLPVAWRFRSAGQVIDFSPECKLAFDEAGAAVAAAVRGIGIIQIASYLVYDEVRGGRLVAILEDFRPPAYQMYIIHPKHPRKPRKLRVFEDFIIDLNAQTRRRWGVKSTD